MIAAPSVEEREREGAAYRKKDGVSVFLSPNASRGQYLDPTLFADLENGERANGRIRFTAGGGPGNFWIRFDGTVVGEKLSGSFEAGIDEGPSYNRTVRKFQGRLELQRAPLSEEEKRHYSAPPER